MNKENENWQDSPQTGREANRENKKSLYRRGDKSSQAPRSNYRRREEGEGSNRPSYNQYPKRNYSRQDGDNRNYRSSYSRNLDEGNRYDGNAYSEGRRDNWRGGDNKRSYGNERREYTPRYNRDNQDGDNRGGYSRGYDNNRGGYDRNSDYRSRKPSFSSDRREGDYSRPYRRRTEDYDPNAKYSKRKQIEYKQQFVDPNEPIRLNKYLANAGVCSRREADEFIETGAVTVNGEIVKELGTKVKRSDEVKFNGELVSIEKKVYVLLNKPKDCVTTMDDPQERQTVMDFVKNACDERIYPVGRLDRKTTGVLLLTNDGDLASKLTHPKYDKKKIYHVTLDRNIVKADLEKIAEGIELEDGLIKADEVGYTDEFKRNQVGIEIHSGKNRIVRRIFESLGYRVTKLDRVYFAGLTKKGLRRGQWRYLSEQEVSFLKMGSFE
ncbi:pseudouridine synthase Rsu [Bacteroides coprosuis DSM 18011]|uniref:Pseudouridine synthase n=1 Tax=Bacteroides coprosuis DSM 18011 TaxID=679937 RepID=F3ZPP0_9BACE|nr:pseudouridine synthase [Bacteroides coprosuis]EGJ70399.1 pseudouridine synthase Rsu [Bacteroides coprosuis DSM 18011]